MNDDGGYDAFVSACCLAAYGRYSKIRTFCLFRACIFVFNPDMFQDKFASAGCRDWAQVGRVKLDVHVHGTVVGLTLLPHLINTDGGQY